MSEKIQRLQNAMREAELDGLLLTRRDNIAWLTEGATFYVVDRAETGVASLLITHQGVTLIAPDNELPRILAEETLPFPLRTVSYPWFTEFNKVLTSLPLSRLGSDTQLPETVNCEAQLIAMRSGLNPAERERFFELGQQVATLVEKVARRVRRGMTERQVEAEIYAECLPSGIRPLCTLVAADQRITDYKHPIPGATAVQQKMLITLGAERHGLNVSLSRMVHLGEPSAADRHKLQAVAEIHADMLAASLPDRRWQDIFGDIQASYARQGYADAWQTHHQGGPAGYGCRDFIVAAETSGLLAVNQALAWNPTLPGVKSEETAMVTEEGLRFLTRTDDWPVITLQRGNSVWTFADWLVI
ncbi:M24 family metallopeptidase [Erwinia sp.]|uniref:M24 family metallopeptidase n=1 Tax=Erwinia citreus TaxID=558 RepID=UPI003C77EA81